MCIYCGRELASIEKKFCSLAHKRSYYVSENRRKNKLRAIGYKGGKCVDCGYSRNPAALHFHHPNGDKEFGIASKGTTRAWEKIVEELDKCILVCSNCHAERHFPV